MATSPSQARFAPLSARVRGPPLLTVSLAIGIAALHMLPNSYVPEIQMSAAHFATNQIPEALRKQCYWQRWEPEREGRKEHPQAGNLCVFLVLCSFLYKGFALEGQMGSLRFAILTVELLAMTLAFTCLTAWTWSQEYQGSSAGGFVGVTSALKVLLTASTPGTWCFAAFLPVKYACWFELALVPLFLPASWLLYIFCGLLAGLAHSACRQSSFTSHSPAEWRPAALRLLGASPRPLLLPAQPSGWTKTDAASSAAAQEEAARNSSRDKQEAHRQPSIMSSAAEFAYSCLFLSPLLTSLVGTAFAVTSAMLTTRQTGAPLDVWFLPFAMACFAYSFDRTADTAAGGAPIRAAFLSSQQWMSKGLFLGGSACLLAYELTHMLWNAIALVLPLLAFALAYTVRLIPVPLLLDGQFKLKWVSIKSLPCMKNLIVPLGWSMVVLLTKALLVENGFEAGDLGIRNFFQVVVFCWVFTGAMAADCRDYFEDNCQGISTLPTMLGLRASYVMGEVLVLGLILLSSLAFLQQGGVCFYVFGLAFHVPVEAIGLLPALLLYLPVGLLGPHYIHARAGYKPLAMQEQALVEALISAQYLPICLILPATWAAVVNF